MNKILLLLIVILGLGSATVDHSHQAASPTSTKNSDKLEANRKSLQDEFNKKCKGKPELYKPTFPAATADSDIEEEVGDSSFQLFSGEELPEASKEMRENVSDDNISGLLWNHPWEFILSFAMIWFIILVILILTYLFCIYKIFFVRAKRANISETNKKIFATILIVLMITIIVLSIRTYNEDSEESFKEMSGKADCVMLYNGLAFIDSQKNTDFKNWEGLNPYKLDVDQVNTFMSKTINAAPYSDFKDAKGGDKFISPYDKAVKAITALKSSKTTLPNPDAVNVKKTPNVNSAFLVQLNKDEATISTELSKMQKTVKGYSTEYQSVNKDITTITSDYTKTFKAKIATQSDKIVNYALQVSEFVKTQHQFILDFQEQLYDYYYYVQIFLIWNKIIITTAGVLGFLLLMFSNKNDSKNIGGNMMHCSWCYGTFFLIIYIFVIIEYYFYGVSFQGGYCQPLKEISQNNKYIKNSWKSNEYPELQDIAEQCIYNSKSTLDNTLDIGKADLSKLASTLDKDLGVLAAAKAQTAPNLKALTTDETSCNNIKSDYAKAIDNTGKTANAVLTEFNKFSDYAATGTYQTTATCKVSQDEFSFTKCPSNYPAYVKGQSEAMDGKQHCFLVNGSLPTDLDSKRYVSTYAGFKTCKDVTTAKTPTKKLQEILALYAKSVSSYQTAVTSQILPLCPKIKSAATEVPTDIKTSNTAITSSEASAKKAQTALKKDFTTPVNQLSGNLDCSFIKDKFIADEKEIVCRYLENEIWYEYIWYSIEGLLLTIFILLVAYLTYQHFRLSTTTQIYKSDFEFGTPDKNQFSQNFDSHLGYTPQQGQQYVQQVDELEQNPEQQQQALNQGLQQELQQIEVNQQQQPVGY